MAIKRFTIELDDSPDTGQTSPPSSFLKKEDFLPGQAENTGVPSSQRDYRQDIEGEEGLSRTPSKGETIGRTPADLVFAFACRPEFMATALTFLAFLISVGKLQQVKDLWIPVALSFCLNSVWFGVKGVGRFFSKSAK